MTFDEEQESRIAAEVRIRELEERLKSQEQD